MRKRWLSALLCLCLVLSLLPMAAHAQTLETYLALGDSITTGFGLADEWDSFPLKLIPDYFTSCDMFAQNGYTSTDLKENLLDNIGVRSKVTDADFITITIGGNDLLDALYGYLAEKYNAAHPEEPQITAEEIADKLASLTMYDLSLIQELIGYMSGFQTSDAAKTALAAYSTNLATILSTIGTLNPDAQVVVLNQYNPYKQAAENAFSLLAAYIGEVSDAHEAGVTALNGATAAVVNGYANVQVADVKTVSQRMGSN